MAALTAGSELFVSEPRVEARHPIRVEAHGPLHHVVAGLIECTADGHHNLRGGVSFRVQGPALWLAG